MSLRNAFKHSVIDRGTHSEQRVIASCDTLPENLPPWFLSIRKAGKEQDANGIDLIVETGDIGLLYVQVKSSQKGARKFSKEKGIRSKYIAIIVVSNGISLARIRKRLMASLQALRTEIRPDLEQPSDSEETREHEDE